MNQLLRTEFKRGKEGGIEFYMSWEDTKAKSKWTIVMMLTNEQLDDLRVRISSFQNERTISNR